MFHKNIKLIFAALIICSGIWRFTESEIGNGIFLIFLSIIPIFLYYKAAFYFANAQSKEALIQLENALKLKPKLIKQFIEINPSILRNQSVVDLIARYKSSKIRKH